MAKQEEIIGENLLSKDVQHIKPGEGVEKTRESIETSKSLRLGLLGDRLGWLKSWKLWVSIVVFILIIIAALTPVIFVVKSAQNLRKSAEKVQLASQTQDLGQIKSAIGELKGDLVSFEKSLNSLMWAQIIPVIGDYWKDARNGSKGGLAAIEAAELLIPIIDPYADLLGFKPSANVTGYVIDQSKYREFNEPGAEGAKTAAERIDFIVASLPDLTPKLGPVGEKLQIAKQVFSSIDPKRYPEEFKGIPVRKGVEETKALIESTATLVVDGKPMLEAAPYLVGRGVERKYLVVFQNDKELRPTGGFMTGYSIITVKDGKVEPVRSDDIYNIDKRYKAHIKAPQPFLDRIKVPYSANPNWRLRDMNWSADFKSAMNLFFEEAKSTKTAGLQNVDGIIAVDTNILVDILKITGKIGVPGYGNYSADTDKRCNCPQVIYELESYADVEKPIVWDPNTGKIVYGEIVDNRKEVLGPLVNSVLANALAQPKTKFPDLTNALLKNLQEKHVMMYIFDEKTQKALEAFGIAGRIREYDGDYLSVVDANLGGRKANMYFTQEVRDEIEVKGDKAVHNLTITYRNPEKHDGWLNSVLPNYMRVYVPQGAKLIDSSGAGDIEVMEDLGKTVFAGLFELRPEGVAEVHLSYELPKKNNYKMLIQTQPGKAPFHYTINFGRRSEEFQLAGDKELRFE